MVCEVICVFLYFWFHSMNCFSVSTRTETIRRHFWNTLKAPWIRAVLYIHNAGLWVCGKERCVLIPDIRHCSEHAIFQRLWRHPADRQQALPSFTVVIRLINISRHAKIWREKWNQRLGKPLNITHSVRERKLLRAHPFPLTSSLPLSIYIKTPLPQALAEIQTLIFKADRVGSALSNQGRLKAAY